MTITEDVHPEVKRKIIKRFIQVFSQLIIFSLILFLTSGRWNWFWVWIYIITGILILVFNAFIISPELIAERAQPKSNVKKWDKILSSINALNVLGILIIAGLDERFNWSVSMSPMIHVAGILFLIIGNLIFTWAMASNKYFSTAVRIQYDRGHSVADSGPYQYVRHPGYVGFIVFNFATPLIFGSLWGLIPALLNAVVFIIRTWLEDNTLKKELDGYKEYSNKVRYRLIPGIW